MTTTQRAVVQQNNDETLQFTVYARDTAPADQPFNITGMTLDFWIKSTSLTPDTDPSTVHLSTSTGEITATQPTLGICQVTIAKSRLATAGTRWYRLDVTSGGQVRTAGKGDLVIDPL